MREDFDWREAADEIIVPSTQAVAVYLNPDGEIVIRQERHWNEEEDTCIIIPFFAARRLIEKLEALISAQVHKQ